ncbi:MAG: hypothetical protein P8R32_01165 [Candidatus Poseidoniia archaeon]|nr:hypothetical protein [Candidatus Poseidoniia archaeon]
MRQILVFTALAIAAMFILTSNVSAEPEYENPDLQLKFNWKEEGDLLSPQTKLPSDPEAQKSVQAQYTNTAGLFKSDRQPVNVGTWTSEAVEFDVSLSINSFDIWWQDQENGDDSCVWTISIEVNSAEVSNDESDCQDDGTELTKRTHNLATSVNLVAGDTLGINLVYEGWNDIKIYYDNSTYDTGLNIVGKHNFFFAPVWSGSTVKVEFAEAWPVNWDTNLNGGYIMLMGDDMYMADNSKASVSEGNEYTIKMTNGSAEVTSTIITWNEVSGNGLRLMMDYNSFDHAMGGNNTNGSAGSPPLLTLNLQKASGLLGDDEGLLGLPGFEIMIAIPAIAFVARKYRTN